MLVLRVYIHSLRRGFDLIGFEFNGQQYRSINEFCLKNNISCSKVYKLRRNYRRAQKDILVAIRWVLGIEVRSCSETLTDMGIRERELAYLRQLKHKAKQRGVNRHRALEIINMGI